MLQFKTLVYLKNVVWRTCVLVGQARITLAVRVTGIFTVLIQHKKKKDYSFNLEEVCVAIGELLVEAMLFEIL